MTLKTALIITGDASSAAAALDETAQGLGEVEDAANRAATGGARELGKEIAGAGQRGKPALAETAQALGRIDERAGKAGGGAAALGREIVNASRRGKTAIDETTASVNQLDAAASRAAGAGAAALGGGIATGGKTAAAGLKLSNQQLMNMQFQVNDMAVMLASGQNPFTMIMQQGMQIGQMFGPGASVGQALKATGAGIFTFLTNPINLFIGATALAAGAIPLIAQAFTGSEAEEAKNSLEDLRRLVDDLKQSSSAAGDEIEKALKRGFSSAELVVQAKLTAQELRTSYELELEAIEETAGNVLAFLARQQSGLRGAVANAPDQAQRQLGRYVQQLADGAITAEKFRQEVGRLAIDETISQKARTLAVELFNGSRQAREYAAALDAMAEASGRIRQVDLSGAGRAAGEAGDTYAGKSYLKDRRDADRAANDAAQATAQRERNAATLADLDAELAALSLTGAEREAALAQLREEQQIRAAIAGLGKTATADEISHIQAVIPQINARNEADKQRLALLREQTQAASALGSALGQAMTGFAEGGDAAEEAAIRLASQIAELIIQSQLLAAFGNGSGGLTPGGSFLSSLASAVFGGFRAEGGPVEAGKSYIVGEKRPEIFVPGASGTILPRIPAPANTNSGGGSGSRGGEPARLELRVSVSGARGNAEIEEMVRRGVSAGLSSYDADVLPARVGQIANDPRAR